MVSIRFARIAIPIGAALYVILLPLAAQQIATEENKSALVKLAENSKLYTGISGGLGMGLNKMHSAGYLIGMTVDYLAYKTYGIHFAALTGEYATKASTISGEGTSFAIASGDTFGVLSFDFAGIYALPAVYNFRPAFGAGLSLYQLSGGGYDFSQTLAPLLLASVYYDLIERLQIGVVTQLVLPYTSKIQVAGRAVSLDSTVAETAWLLQLSLRYAWF